MKIKDLKTDLAGLRDQVTKAFGEIRAKLDEQKAKIDELTEQLGDADLPEDAQAVLAELKTLTQQLDDIVPDAPATPS